MQFLKKAFNWHARYHYVLALGFIVLAVMADGFVVPWIVLAAALQVLAGVVASIQEFIPEDEGLSFPTIDPEMIPVKERP
jgi:hypothetical protein